MVNNFEVPFAFCLHSTGEVKDGVLRIGDTSAPVYMQTPDRGSSTAKVPDILFYDNPQHLSVMQDMLQDYLLGEHILLVGNQVIKFSPNYNSSYPG